MERGAVLWCDLEPKRGREQSDLRPVIVFSASRYNLSKSPMIAIIPCTKSPAKSPLHVELAPAETGLKSNSTVLVDQLKFVDRGRLRPGLAGRLTPEALAKVERSLM